ncbi:MAG: hypothetical protein ABH879_04055 [archaeon]
MIDTTLIDKLKVLADKERKIKEFKRRLRIKGKVTAKGITKKGNKTLTIKRMRMTINSQSLNHIRKASCWQISSKSEIVFQLREYKNLE